MNEILGAPKPVPTVIVGKTQSGKTFKASLLFDSILNDRAIFFNVQWRQYFQETETTRICYDIETVVTLLSQGIQKIVYNVESYADLDALVDYLIRVHRDRHKTQETPFPPIYLFLDEIWKVAPRHAKENNPAVRVFTEGFQHNIIGYAITQWVSQTSHLILGNAYQWYFFSLWERDVELLETNYRMPIPYDWLKDIHSYNYVRYDGDYWLGDSEGNERAYNTDKADEPGADDVAEIPGETDVTETGKEHIDINGADGSDTSG